MRKRGTISFDAFLEKPDEDEVFLKNDCQAYKKHFSSIRDYILSYQIYLMKFKYYDEGISLNFRI